MPSRYKNRDHANHGEPNKRIWEALNKVLFGDETDLNIDLEYKFLKNASMDELIFELKNRYGATSVIITI